MHIHEDEAFPVFELVTEVTRPGGLDIPDDSFTQEELTDLARVTALYEAWQARLKNVYWAVYWPERFGVPKANAETPT